MGEKTTWEEALWTNLVGLSVRPSVMHERTSSDGGVDSIPVPALSLAGPSIKGLFPHL